MTTIIRDQIQQSIRHFRLPAYDEITDVGLYLEQTTRYINEYLFPLGEDAAITSSMISNYVKHKLVSSPVHKQYSRDQIAMLIFISMTKSILSLDQIRQLREVGLHLFEKKDAYEDFRTSLEEQLMAVFGYSQKPVEEIEESSGEKLIVRSAMTAISHKIYLNMCFAAIEQKDMPEGQIPVSTGKARKKAKT